MSVQYELDGEVAIVTLNRVERRNAIDRPTADALAAAFRRFAAHDDAAVAVLTGAGGTFCAGADLKAIAEGTEMNRVELVGDGPLGPTRMLLPKPVIAAVEGHAVAGGLELALWCDLRVAARDAIFGVFCRRWGVPLVDGGTVRLPRLVGQSFALDMILTGREVSAEEGHRVGLVNRLTEPGKALAAALELARDIASQPATCMRHDRLSVYEQWGRSLPDAMTNELRHGMRALNAPDFVDNVRAFSARRRDE
jgi:enoyl-CoA hydratase